MPASRDPFAFAFAFAFASGSATAQPPWPALPIGPTFTREPGPSVTGRVAAPGQARVTVFVSFGGVTRRPVMRIPEPPVLCTGQLMAKATDFPLLRVTEVPCAPVRFADSVQRPTRP